jgi:hypothetical protein
LIAALYGRRGIATLVRCYQDNAAERDVVFVSSGTKSSLRYDRVRILFEEAGLNDDDLQKFIEVGDIGKILSNYPNYPMLDNLILRALVGNFPRSEFMMTKKIIEMAAHEFNVRVEDMFSPHQSGNTSSARNLAMYTLKYSQLYFGPAKIAKIFGYRSHNSVFSIIRRIEDKIMANDEEICGHYYSIWSMTFGPNQKLPIIFKSLDNRESALKPKRAVICSRALLADLFIEAGLDSDDLKRFEAYNYDVDKFMDENTARMNPLDATILNALLHDPVSPGFSWLKIIMESTVEVFEIELLQLFQKPITKAIRAARLVAMHMLREFWCDTEKLSYEKIAMIMGYKGGATVRKLLKDAERTITRHSDLSKKIESVVKKISLAQLDGSMQE